MMQTVSSILSLWFSACVLVACSGFATARGEEAEEKDTPERLSQYIEASIGDAQYLNPVLYADNASGTIVGNVFEGLIDRDRDLNWRGRVAERWEITEEAYFQLNPADKRSPEEIVTLLRAEQAKQKGEKSALADCLRNVTQIAIEPAGTVTRKVMEFKEEAEAGPTEVTVTVQLPARVKLTLKAVAPDVFKTIGPVIGPDYFASFKADETKLTVAPAEFEKNRAKYVKEFLSVTEHNPVIVFHLRKGVKFHDGHEVDSGDVKFTYDMLVDPKNGAPAASDCEPVKSVEAVDKYTVRVVYKELCSPGFGTWSVGILPEHLLNEEILREEATRKGKPFDEYGLRQADFNQHPVGCGPFRFVEWQRDRFIRLSRFDGYWDGPPEFKEYLCRVIPDLKQQREEFIAGRLDAYSAQPNEAEALSKDGRFQCFSGLSYGYTYIGYNMRRELFQDRRVRRALGMAIDVDAMIKTCVSGQGERITGPFVLQTDFYDQSIKPLPYDPEGAKRLLAEAGWKPNKEGWLEKDGKVMRFTLLTNSGNDMRWNIMAIALDSWKKIGVDVSAEAVEWAVFLERHVNKGDFDAVFLGWGMGIEPDLYLIWHSSQSNPYQMNFCAFKNDEADALIIRIRQESDPKKQVELCHRLHQIIADEQPYTFLYVVKWTALLNKRIVIVRRNAKGEVTGYERIKQAKSGDYTFEFRRWTKLPELPAELR